MKFSHTKALIFIFILSIGIGLKAFAQSTYHIYLTDKKGTEYNPYTYLHPKAIERRIINGLDLCDSSDFPINDNYFNAISQLADSVKGMSRWLNVVFIYVSEQNIKKIKNLPYVSRVEVSAKSVKNPVCNYKTETNFDTLLTKKQKFLLASQLDRMNGKILKANNLDGNGVRIAILDAGFRTYTENPAFENIRIRKGIIATYDFVKNRTNANSGMTHGTNVFSCIGGQIGNYQIGLATGAEFLLARTESFTEFFNEEENWLLAAEWADKNGVDIINSSLGYTTQRYLPENMDGKTAFISRAAQLAVDKGILVVSSAGNEGSGKWKRVAAPGDAAGVLTVGGIDPYTGIHSDFSSFGPSWDKRLKPEVCAYGIALVAGISGLHISEGTSFSSPFVTGFAACLKQRYPTLRNAKIKELICSSGDLYPYYDYAHGYGVPQPAFLLNDTFEIKPTLSIVEDEYEVTLKPIGWDTALNGSKLILNDSSITNTLVDKMDSTFTDSILVYDKLSFKPPKWYNGCKTSVPDYLFYHIKNKKGYLDKYYVLDMKDEENKSVSISKEIAEKPFSIGIFYKGYHKEIIISE